MKIIYILVKIIVLMALGCSSLSEKVRESDVAGRYYKVKAGDTLSAIAHKTKLSVEEIKEVNGIDNDRSLPIGRVLFLPDPDPIGQKIAKLKPTSAKSKSLAKPKEIKKQHIFDFPVPSGTIVYNFSKAKERPYDGIGIKANKGTRIICPLDGRVLFVGNDGTKFGLLVILEHQDPYITVYTHLDRALVKTGQLIKRGEPLGTVGQSGGVSFPHLHFQIRINQIAKDPRLFLKAF